MSNPAPDEPAAAHGPDHVDWDGLLGVQAGDAGNPERASTEPPGSGADPLPSRRALRDSTGRSTRSGRRSRLAVDPKREKRSRSGASGCLLALVVLGALLAGAFTVLQGPISQLVQAVQGPADYTGTGDAKVVVVIRDGETGRDIGNSLVKQDVVKSFQAFYSLLLKEFPAPVFQPGAYRLSTKMSARAALNGLLDPASKLVNTVVIPEGTAAAEVLKLVSTGTSLSLADLQGAAADVGSYGLPAEAKTVEGFLFPATYTFPPGVTARDAVKTLVGRQFQALDAAGVAPADRWKTIVLASLIQREAGLKPDFYKVSRVFQNRLDPAKWASGLLESDATVAYGTGKTNLVTTTDAERADAGNPYNTYQRPGLPVGPISNPGDLAIDAALKPVAGSWLFFVTWNLTTGETIFSTTSAEHDAAVAKWQAWMKDNPGNG